MNRPPMNNPQASKPLCAAATGEGAAICPLSGWPRFAGMRRCPDSRLVWVFVLGFVFVAVGLSGCRTRSPSRYISPRVTGRVLDRETLQPLHGVRVRRVTSDTGVRPLDAPKGGQTLEKKPAVRTRADGTFDLASERSLSFLQRGGWYSVSLAFEHAGYERFVADYTLADATQTAKGEPWVNAGDILLDRKEPLSTSFE